MTAAAAHSRLEISRLKCLRMCFRSAVSSRWIALAGEMQLGEPDRAEGEREGELDQAVHRADQLQAAAADVGHERALAREREVVGHRPIGERGLGLGVDDPERDVQLLPHPPHEPGAVLRLPNGRGGHGRHPPHAAPLADLTHAAQGLDGAVHRRVVEAPGAGQSRGQSRLVLQFVDDGEAGGGVVLGDEEADGVGADVDRGDALALDAVAALGHAVAFASPRSSA